MQFSSFNRFISSKTLIPTRRDHLVTKGLKIPFRGKKYKGRVGVTIFNITNHWNPRDVQNNLASPQFGTFYNSPDRSFRTKFEFVKF